jgi:Prenyltransferase and squalene oxidase repeat
VSWQVATFAGLALVLLGGFAWYERSRPTARLVALVAALAALAIAGRLAFAPIPNVVATTDIALITGYALGGAPGFAVGALAAPVSNIWLGQGPWTVWQMAGWGLVGLGGAWLAVITRRRVNRLGLALACAFAGLAYGALLDLYTMVSYGGEQSLDRYLALSSLGIPFNVAHALGNFTIALAAGPALVRMISRYRTRLEFEWRPAGALPVVILALAIGAATIVAPPAARAAGSPAWLAGSQNSDGGFAAARGQPSSPAMTGWVMLGLEGAGVNPLDLRRGGETPVSYLSAQIGRLRSVGDLERSILALSAAGVDPHAFGGTDLVAELRSRRDRDGSVDGQANLTAFYALAMRSAGAAPESLKRSAIWLRRAQNSDGGWGLQPEAPSEADTSGAVLQGLVAAGAGGSSTRAGAAYLRQSQRPGGGWSLGSSGIVNSQSTAWAVQGLAAAGGGGDAISGAEAYLRRLRAADGHVRYSPASDQTPVWVTAQVVLAIERRPFPVPAVERAVARGTGQNGDPGSANQPAQASSGGSSPESTGGDSSAGSAPGGGHRSSGSHPAGGSPAASESVGSGAAPGASGGEAAAGGGDSGAQPAASGELAAAPGDAPATSAADGSSDHTTTVILAGIAAAVAIAAGGWLFGHRRGYF